MSQYNKMLHKYCSGVEEKLDIDRTKTHITPTGSVHV